ncbi:hypothetical protein [Catenulispora pinisilvae]|uniref:hypothetical protein n=1 Tax=Catenulispora pinisilvae TaxID=2705253 RepID=UPI001890EA06|nr:hypothetical protein [Catenulispora pinisilvae]
MLIRRDKVLMMAVAAVILPVAACGSSQPAAKITPGPGGDTTTASASPTTSATSTVPTASTSSAAPTSNSSPAAAGGLPDLTLPPDVTLQFNLPKTGDAAKDGALQGLVQEEEAQFKATELGVSSGPIVDDFDIQDANNSIKALLILQQRKGETVTGTNIYYDWKFPEVDPSEKSMQITFCEDENKFLSKSRTTGQSLPQQTGLAQIYSFKVDMLLDHDGRWKASYYTWKAGDAECQAAEGH